MQSSEEGETGLVQGGLGGFMEESKSEGWIWTAFVFVGLQDGLCRFMCVKPVFVSACGLVPASAPTCLTQGVLESM